MKRIVCLDTTTQRNSSLYNVQGCFMDGLNRALSSIGLESRLIFGRNDFPGDMIRQVIEDLPDCTITFNGIPSNDQGYYICDDLRIPHISLLLDAPYLFLEQINSNYAIFTSVDRSSVEMYRKMGFKNLLFLPHAADSRDALESEGERIYDAVMLSSFIDSDKMRGRWKETYPQHIWKIMDRAVEIGLSNPGSSAPFAVIEALNKEGSKPRFDNIPLWMIFHEIDNFIRGKDRIELIRSIRDARIDLFGCSHKGSWKDVIRQDNVVIHDEIDFRDALKVMRKSKVVLNSSPHIPDGSHERVFNGLLSGAAVLSSHSKYLSEEFLPGSGVQFYSPGKYGHVNETLCKMLADEGLRSEEAAKGKALVLERHTWEVRARQLRDEIGPIVDAMNGRQ